MTRLLSNTSSIVLRFWIPLSMIAVISLTASGCATPKVWSHASKTQQQFYQENSQCMAMSNTGGSTQQIVTPQTSNSGTFAGGFADGFNQGNAIAAARRQREIHDQCMYGNGWRLVAQ